MVAPPTSGQSHEVESNFSDPFRIQDPDADSAGSGAGSARYGSRGGTTAKPTITSAGKSDVQKPALSAHEQWILSQRPPHW